MNWVSDLGKKIWDVQIVGPIVLFCLFLYFYVAFISSYNLKQ